MAYMLMMTGLVLVLLFSSLQETPKNGFKEKEKYTKLEVGTCFHTYGDFGTTKHLPDVVECIQSSGKDSYLSCLGSTFGKDGFTWLSCGKAGYWFSLDSLYRDRDLLVKIECPKACPSLDSGSNK